MQMVKRVALLSVVVLLFLAIFAPKRELYYLLENRLFQEDIIISNEEIEGGLFGLTLRHPELYVKGIKVANMEEIYIFSLLFYSSISIKGILTDSSLHRWSPKKIDTITAHYQIFSPTNISLQANGSFGSLEGYASITKNFLHIDLIEEGSFNEIKPLLKKGEEGWYYETSF